MTIKQQGGVFGRNPTFNSVEASQEITVDAPGSLKVMANGDAWQLPTDRSFSISTGFGAAYLRSINHNGFHGPIYHNGNQHVFLFADVEKARFNTSGNLAFVNGAGIDFSATSGTGTSELFDDYEEGTWTPTFTAEWTTAPTVTSAQYTKVGRQVTVTLLATGGVVTAGGGIGGLPFGSNSAQGAGAYGGNSDTTESLQGTVGQSASSITNIPARTLTGDTWQITAAYFT